MENSTPKRPTPVAFWQRNGFLWVEFSDGHLQGFQAASPEADTRMRNRPPCFLGPALSEDILRCDENSDNGRQQDDEALLTSMPGEGRL